jgi:hypothetical protein
MSKPFLRPVPETGPQGKLVRVALAERTPVGGCTVMLAAILLPAAAVIARMVIG